jgi:hypothetical protein
VFLGWSSFGRFCQKSVLLSKRGLSRPFRFSQKRTLFGKNPLHCSFPLEKYPPRTSTNQLQIIYDGDTEQAYSILFIFFYMNKGLDVKTYANRQHYRLFIYAMGPSTEFPNFYGT